MLFLLILRELRLQMDHRFTVDYGAINYERAVFYGDDIEANHFIKNKRMV